MIGTFLPKSGRFSNHPYILSVILFSALLCSPFIDKARAVTLLAGSSANETDPGTFAWNNVGVVNSASFVFLGDINNNGTYWVITAYHDATGAPPTVQLNGTGDSTLETYNTVADSYVRLTNTGLSVSGYPALQTNADLAMFRITLSGDTSNLTTLSLSTSLPADTSTLYLVGNGGGTKRWGTNNADVVVGPGLNRRYPTDDGAGTNIAFLTDYDTDSLTNTESQAILGDSGGAVFVLNGGVYELAGVIFATGEDGGGKDYTYAANVADYRDKILAAAVPEPETWALLFFGGMVLVLGMRRSTKIPVRVPVISGRSERPRIPGDPSPFL